jgi:hypothetical protein
MLSAEGRFRDIGVIGLGAGALAGYAGNGARMDFFEVDEAVIRIAENPGYFTYLADARARPGVTLRTMAVDGRLGLGAMPEASYDLVVVDAFSSDAIPTHLITREAVALFASRLKPRGVLAFHVSNRFFDLEPSWRGLPTIGVSSRSATTRTCRPRERRKPCGPRRGSCSRAPAAISVRSRIRRRDGCGCRGRAVPCGPTITRTCSACCKTERSPPRRDLALTRLSGGL